MLKYIKKLLRTIKSYILIENPTKQSKEVAISVEHFVSHSKKHKPHKRRPYKNKIHDKT